ncbi:hypothetical protein HKX48_007212 [Thoreauomyces humboldtii]|nr:hypothetical protein HKX48_007212 [Thoreauomyces humboldtii]
MIKGTLCGTTVPLPPSLSTIVRLHLLRAVISQRSATPQPSDTLVSPCLERQATSTPCLAPGPAVWPHRSDREGQAPPETRALELKAGNPQAVIKANPKVKSDPKPRAAACFVSAPNAFWLGGPCGEAYVEHASLLAPYKVNEQLRKVIPRGSKKVVGALKESPALSAHIKVARELSRGEKLKDWQFYHSCIEQGAIRSSEFEVVDEVVTAGKPLEGDALVAEDFPEFHEYTSYIGKIELADETALEDGPE